MKKINSKKFHALLYVLCTTFYAAKSMSFSPDNQRNNQTHELSKILSEIIDQLPLNQSYGLFNIENPKIQRILNAERSNLKNLLIYDFARNILPYYSTYEEEMSEEEFQETLRNQASLTSSEMGVSYCHKIMPESSAEYTYDLYSNTAGRKLKELCGFPYNLSNEDRIIHYLDCGEFTQYTFIVGQFEKYNTSMIIVWDKYYRKICQVIKHSNKNPIKYLYLGQSRHRCFLLTELESTGQLIKHAAYGLNFHSFTLEQLLLIAKLFKNDFLIPQDHKKAQELKEEVIADGGEFQEKTLLCHSSWQEIYHEIPENVRMLFDVVMERWTPDKKNLYLKQNIVTSLRQRSASTFQSIRSHSNEALTFLSPLKLVSKIRSSGSIESLKTAKSGSKTPRPGGKIKGSHSYDSVFPSREEPLGDQILWPSPASSSPRLQRTQTLLRLLPAALDNLYDKEATIESKKEL